MLLSMAAGSTASPAPCPADFWPAPAALKTIASAVSRDENDNGLLCVKRHQSDPAKLNAVDDWLPGG